MKMILKRVANIIATTPVLICLFFFFAFLFHLVNQSLFDLDVSGVVGLEKFFKGAIAVIVAALAVWGMIGCIYFFFKVLLTGDGILWRRVGKYNFLLNRKGEVVHFFEKPELIWRFHQMFLENRLCESQVLK